MLIILNIVQLICCFFLFFLYLSICKKYGNFYFFFDNFYYNEYFSLFMNLKDFTSIISLFLKKVFQINLSDLQV
jgi:hypothetical protein